MAKIEYLKQENGQNRMLDEEKWPIKNTWWRNMAKIEFLMKKNGQNTMLDEEK